MTEQIIGGIVIAVFTGMFGALLSKGATERRVSDRLVRLETKVENIEKGLADNSALVRGLLRRLGARVDDE